MIWTALLGERVHSCSSYVLSFHRCIFLNSFTLFAQLKLFSQMIVLTPPSSQAAASGWFIHRCLISFSYVPVGKLSVHHSCCCFFFCVKSRWWWLVAETPSCFSPIKKDCFFLIIAFFFFLQILFFYSLKSSADPWNTISPVVYG